MPSNAPRDLGTATRGSMRSLALLWLAALPAAAGESGGAGVAVAISLGAAAAVVGSGAAAFVLVRRRKQRRIQAFGPGPVSQKEALGRP